MRRLTLFFCAAALLLGAVACGDDDETSTSDTTASTSTSTSTTESDGPRAVNFEEFVDLEPGSYFIDPDGDEATPLRVIYEVAAEGWTSWEGAVKFSDEGHTALSIITIDNLVREGCNDHSAADPAVGPTVDDLAIALSQLAPFEVTAPPSDVTILGYQGKHLQLTVPDLEVSGSGDSAEFAECTDGNLNSWFSANYDDEAFFGYNAEPGRTEDFWILDVDGTRLVLATQAGPSSPPEDVAEMQAIFDSIQIEA